MVGLEGYTGSLQKNPSRLNARACEPRALGELGEPPGRLTDLQASAWHEIVDNAAYGVLTQADRHSLEVASVLLAEFWKNGAEMKGTHISMLNTLLSKMGMNPSDRSRVSVTEPKKENPFAKFVRNWIMEKMPELPDFLTEPARNAFIRIYRFLEFQGLWDDIYL